MVHLPHWLADDQARSSGPPAMAAYDGSDAMTDALARILNQDPETICVLGASAGCLFLLFLRLSQEARLTDGMPASIDANVIRPDDGRGPQTVILLDRRAADTARTGLVSYLATTRRFSTRQGRSPTSTIGLSYLCATNSTRCSANNDSSRPAARESEQVEPAKEGDRRADQF